MIFFHRLKYPNLYHGRHRKGLWPVWTHKLLWHFHCDFTVFCKNAVFWHPSIHTCNFLNDLLSFKGLGSGVTVLIFSWTTHYTVAVELFVMATCLSTHLIITYLSTPLWASNPRGVASRLDMRLGGRGGADETIVWPLPNCPTNYATVKVISFSFALVCPSWQVSYYNQFFWRTQKLIHK